MKYIATLALAAALPLSAQTENSEPELTYEMDPVVVTGELWESELQRTTASVTVLDAASFQTDGTRHFEDLVNTIPNLTWTGGTSRPRYIQIRGIGENSQFEGETPDSSVRFLVDDLDFTGIGTIGNLFDVAQVEVLRGPQAGAFGANAAGGVIKIVTNEPTPFWTGQVEGSLGTDDLFAGGLAVGGPILESDPDQLSFRLALHQHFSDGFRDNHFHDEDDTNERDELTSRFKLRWKPSADWQWDGTLFYADADNGYDEWTLDNTEFDTYSDEPGRDEQESLAGSIKGRWTGLDAVEVSSITTGTTTDSLYSFDSDWTDAMDPRSYNGFLTTKRKRDVFSQELRFDSAAREDALGLIDRWSLGVYYHTLDEKSDVFYQDMFGVGAVTSDYETENFALFSQLAHDLSEKQRLILGLRYEHYDVDFASDTTEDYFGSLVAGRTTSSDSGDLWGGKLTYEQDLNDEHMVFASVARGYKAGGANSGAFRETGDPLDYDPETLWNYEAGLRSKWFDRTLDTQLTVFHLDRRDAQLRDSSGAGGFFRYFTSNQGNVDHFGAEAEASWYFAPDWILSASLGLVETEVDSTDSELANSPSYSYSLRLDYRPLDGFFANAEIVGSDEYFESNNQDNRDERVRNAFTVVNAAAGYRYENWTLTLWVKNVFDERYEKRVFFFSNELDTSTPEPDDFAGDKRYESPADPRQAGVTLNYSW